MLKKLEKIYEGVDGCLCGMWLEINKDKSNVLIFNMTEKIEVIENKKCNKV